MAAILIYLAGVAGMLAFVGYCTARKDLVDPAPLGVFLVVAFWPLAVPFAIGHTLGQGK